MGRIRFLLSDGDMMCECGAIDKVQQQTRLEYFKRRCRYIDLAAKCSL